MNVHHMVLPFCCITLNYGFNLTVTFFIPSWKVIGCITCEVTYLSHNSTAIFNNYHDISGDYNQSPIKYSQ